MLPAKSLPSSNEAEPFRSVRAPLRDLLDEEFQKNYSRFEGITDFSQYLKGLWRNFMVRDEPDQEYGEFLAGREPRDPHHPG